LKHVLPGTVTVCNNCGSNPKSIKSIAVYKELNVVAGKSKLQKDLN
jgi:hypothetical protein